MRRFSQQTILSAALVAALAATTAWAQPPVARPQPPPQVPGTQTQPRPAAPATPAPQARPAATSLAALQASPLEQPPSDVQLGVRVFPTAQFLGSYDAGRGQRFYLWGCTQSFAEIVAYYQTVLKNKGDLVFDQPAVHMFEVGKFKEADVAFPPSVTVKDYTGGGLPGYMNARPGGSPAYFPTVLQIVPQPGVIPPPQ
jgi:hypothetical protein